LTLNQHRFTVVGIAASDFRGTEMMVPDVIIPLTMQAAVDQNESYLQLRDCSCLKVVGRLKPSASAQQALNEMNLIAAQADQEYLDRKTSVIVTPGAYLNFPEARSKGVPVVVIVLVAVALVLLLACANVSNLLLARATARRKEIAVRLALGASRWRLIRQLLTESLLLAVIGGAAGLLLASWLPPILLAAIPETGADVNLSPNLPVFGYAFLISLITGFVFGLAPAFQATRLNLTSALNMQGAAVSPRFSRSRLRSTLVVVQVAASLTLLIGAGLMLRSLRQIQTTDLGFDHRNLIVISADTTSEGYDGQRTAALYRRLDELLTALPGVKSVSLAGAVPFMGGSFTTIELQGQTKLKGELPVNFNSVSPRYFQTLGIPIIRGRQFTEEEAQGSQGVAVVSKAMAGRCWPGEEPLGKHFKSGSSWYEVIGVSRDISSIKLAQADGPFFYQPARPDGHSGLTLILRTDGNREALVRAAVGAVHSLDKNLAVSSKSLEESLQLRLQPARTGAIFSGALSLLALLLATTGIYGVVSYFVTERTREIGIRLALGARTLDVLKLVIRNGMRLALIGVAVGLGGAFALTHFMAGFLFGVTTTDVTTFATVSLFLLVVALTACYIPARRATKVDPLVALRYE
ncbi:MAG: ADOP family duplicated permease, partial [Pyrinomonadaceae bacterium]